MIQYPSSSARFIEDKYINGDIINSSDMYYRRWTRMHLKPGMKYFMKYGVISPKFDRYAYLMATENPEPLQYRTRKVKVNHDKDLDTKLIDNLFLKYPDLKYEPISQNVYPGRQLNTFSYAYSFINEQKKLIKQGYTISKAFELTEAKYHEKMQRKLDQTLLSRGLAISNRARSFLNVYQQQSQYESKLKTQRAQRELEKYELKLQSIRTAAQTDTGAEGILDDSTLEYERIFYDIRDNRQDTDYSGPSKELGFEEIPKNDGPARYQFATRIENRFKNLFDRFYEHAATKDRLEGLTDAEIINQIQSSPSKIKRQMRELMKFFQSKNLKVSLINGKVTVSGPNSHIISEDIKNNPYLKIALLSESLNYERPIYSATENPTKSSELVKGIFRSRNSLKDVRPDTFTKEEKDTIKQNKRRDLQLVVDQEVFYHREAYKVFETQEERLLRLEIKYYDKLIGEYDQNKPKEEGTPQKQKQTELVNLEELRKEAIVNFRRLKFRLEKRYKNISADQFLFPEHEVMGQDLRFQDEIEYEDLLGYLRKKSESRRLTSLDQSKDNKISNSIRILQVGEGVIREGTVSSKSQ